MDIQKDTNEILLLYQNYIPRKTSLGVFSLIILLGIKFMFLNIPLILVILLSITYIVYFFLIDALNQTISIDKSAKKILIERNALRVKKVFTFQHEEIKEIYLQHPRPSKGSYINGVYLLSQSGDPFLLFETINFLHLTGEIYKLSETKDLAVKVANSLGVPFEEKFQLF